MTMTQNELLSALVDGELHGKALDEALQLIHNDAQARATWQRYQWVSDVIQGHSEGSNHIDLTQKISAAIEQEPALHKAKILSFPRHIWKQTAGFALAASLGALVVTGVWTHPDNTRVAQNAGKVQVATVASVSKQKQPITGQRWTVGKQEVEQRLNSYLVEHNEYANAPDVFTYARVVSYETGQ